MLIKRRPTILDPQGKAVEMGAHNLGLDKIRKTRIDKYIEFEVVTDNKSEAEKEVKQYCSKLLSNPVMEDYEYIIEELK